jgi:protein-S-isoprenylcysteine O-methyltransferase Ste14
MLLKYPINLSKGLTAFIIMLMMFCYDNFSTAAFIYLALHGSYGMLWLLKDRIFPDKQWEQTVSLAYAVFVFAVLALYWLPGWLLISSDFQPSPGLLATAVALNGVGVMLHFASDSQKYYTLKYKPGLITEGFFSRCRNTNYLGELMIYISFALLAGTWLGFLGIGAFFIGAFIPNMIKKDKSLSRYEGFAEYRKQSGFLFPKLIRW